MIDEGRTSILDRSRPPLNTSTRVISCILCTSLHFVHAIDHYFPPFLYSLPNLLPLPSPPPTPRNLSSPCLARPLQGPPSPLASAPSPAPICLLPPPPIAR